MTRRLTFLIAFAIFPLISRATNVTLQGNFTADDSLQLFSVSLAAPAAVDIRSYGYAGGTTSTGTVAARGGFDTILTLFSASGVFIDDNDDGTGAAVDPTTGQASDARITASLAAGSYIVALTQYDNFSIGNLADGFVETGNHNFTADPGFANGGACPGNIFRDISGTDGRCRNGNWTVDFVNVANVTAIPEPSALLLAGIGFALLLVGRFRQRRKATVLACGFVAALAGVSVQAQTTCAPVPSGPDYCPVSDFLNGQRTLLKIQDLEVIDMGNNATQGQITQFKTSSSNVLAVGQWLPGWSTDESSPVKSFSARMFNQPRATTLSSMSNYNGSGLFTLWLQSLNGTSGDDYYWQPLPAGEEPNVNCGAVADFAQNGYEELALGLSDGRVLILAPNDVNDVTKGFRKSLTQLDWLNDMTAGDFRGDGQHEIAGLVAGPNGGFTIVIYTVDPNSLAVTRAGSLAVNPPGASPDTPIAKLSVARGRFNGAGHDQLAVAFATNSGFAYVEIIDFKVVNGTLAPFEASPAPLFTPDSRVFSEGWIQIKTGQFGLVDQSGNPNNPFDQIAFLSASPTGNGRYFEVLKVDSTSLAISGTAPVSYNQFPGAVGIDVGNFAHRSPDAANPGQTQPNPNAQIAFLYFTGPDANYRLHFTLNIYSVDPVAFNINPNPDSIASDFTQNLSLNAIGPLNLSLVATDIQGRSVTLGEPTKVTMQNASQPTAVIGVPPMHIDYVSPTTAGAAPELLDLSFVWDGYSTTYQQQDTSSYKSSTTNTTSWSFGLQESGTASLTIGKPDDEGLKISDTAKAAQDLKGSSGDTRGSYTSYKYNFTANTGIDDFVSYVNSDFNIWIYPVIGQTVCPSNNSSCGPSDRKPLTIQFSAPTSNPSVKNVDASAIPWYQPPWEPGNIFSYPANSYQVAAAFPTMSQLASSASFDTDTSTSSEQTTWEVGTSATPVTSLNQNYSFDNNFSVTSGVSFGAGSVGGGYDLDVNGSVAFESLTKHTTTLGQSTGLVINKPGTFRNPSVYSYSVTPYIFGVKEPGGVVDNQPLTADVQTFGFLSAMYSVSPVVTQGWWQAIYSQAPDIALNHPARWSKGYGSPPSNGPAPNPCLDPGTGASQTDCPVFSTPTPDTPYTDTFHWMRGLFISNATSPGQGPQLEQVNKGDKLSLQARVYNYSLQNIPSNVARAAFYAAPFNAAGAPEQAVLIDTVALPEIPRFDPSSTTLNWLLTPFVTFDTSDAKYAALLPSGQNSSGVMFYVVVWMEDSSMNLITEMPFHGLTARPPSPGINDPTPTLADWIKNEQNFSNNVGLFYQEISVISPSLGATRHPLVPVASVDVGKVNVSDNRANIGDRVLLTATLLPTGETSGVTVDFYDGDPADGGRLFRVTRIPHLASDAPRLVQALYRPDTCGMHQLFAVVNEGKSFEVKRRAQPLRVACSGGR